MTDIPVEDGAGDASREERIDGILEQLRGDIQLGNIDDVRMMLAERLRTAGITFDADELDGLVASLETA